MTFPFPTPPAPGAVLEVAPGVLWLRMPLPFLLDHVNLYLIEDGAGWALLDTGLGDNRTRALWDGLRAGPLAGRPITRLVLSHFHPDHLGLAAWLAEPAGLPVHMSRTEYLAAQNIRCNTGAIGSPAHRAFYAARGLAPDAVDAVMGRGHDYLRSTTGLPTTFTRLVAGETLTLGGRVFEVLTGGGHSQEGAMLLCRADRLFFPADQVLPRITPNISVFPWEPDEDPLSDYQHSLASLAAQVPEDVLVLPGHHLPFRGLHVRLAEMQAHHADRLAAVLAACAEGPRTEASLIPVLFRRALDAHQMGFAMGETVAHVNRLLRDGRLLRTAGPGGAGQVRLP